MSKAAPRFEPAKLAVNCVFNACPTHIPTANQHGGQLVIVLVQARKVRA
jgi:hypothetical protein